MFNHTKLARFKNKYTGSRCFILGNGPSLNKTNLILLKNAITFGQNRIYLNYKNMGFSTSFLVSVNPLVLKQYSEELSSVQEPIKFFSSASRKSFGIRSDIIYLDSIDEVSFRVDPRKGLWEGATVTYVSLQLAYFMGFSQVILVGVDHNFATKGTPHSTVRMIGSDPNHFSPDYFKGSQWQLPDLETSELAYRMAKYQYEISNRQIIDATVGGMLSIFPKTRLEALL